MCIYIYIIHTYTYLDLHMHICTRAAYTDTGWLWLVGWIKLQVSFAKEPYKTDNILLKGPTILSILLTEATPYRVLGPYGECNSMRHRNHYVIKDASYVRCLIRTVPQRVHDYVIKTVSPTFCNKRCLIDIIIM